MKNIIQNIIFLTLLSLPLTAIAQLGRAPVGQFVYSPKLELITVKKYENVNILTQEGKDRLNFLKMNGWVCQQQILSNVPCSHFAKNQSLPDRVASQILTKYQNFKFNFADEFTSSLINETDFLREYEVRQNVDVAGKNVATYLMRESKNSFAKIQMEVGWDKVYLLVLNEKTIAIHETTTLYDKNRSTRYLVQVSFEKK